MDNSILIVSIWWENPCRKNVELDRLFPVLQTTAKLDRAPVRMKKAKSGSEVIKLFSCSTQLSMKFIMLINVKMSTIVGILTFISNTDKYNLWEFEGKRSLYFSAFELLSVLCWVEHEKSLITSRPGSTLFYRIKISLCHLYPVQRGMLMWIMNTTTTI